MRYLQFAKYTQQGAKGVYDEGYVSRRKTLEGFVAGLGGQILDFYAVASDEWDFVALIEVGDDASSNFALAARVGLFARGNGVIENSMTVYLSTPEEADAAKITANYRAPGQ